MADAAVWRLEGVKAMTSAAHTMEHCPAKFWSLPDDCPVAIFSCAQQKVASAIARFREQCQELANSHDAARSAKIALNETALKAATMAQEQGLGYLWPWRRGAECTSSAAMGLKKVGEVHARFLVSGGSPVMVFTRLGLPDMYSVQ